MIYLDNAATTYSKPDSVVKAVSDAVLSANPGRSGHELAARAARLIFDARETAARFFGAPSSERVIFTSNATHALNIVIHGLLGGGGHVITGNMEHNAVMRPLNALAEGCGVEIGRFTLEGDGSVDPESFNALFRDDTRLVICTGASNVTGEIFPFREIGRLCRSRGVPFAVDAAQTAGAVPMNVEEDFIDFLAFTGHKHLFGPQGTGGLVLGEGARVVSLMQGGTGSLSEKPIQPDFLPDMLEAGTLNTPGIAGLAAGIQVVSTVGVPSIRKNEQALTGELVSGLESLDGVKIHGPAETERRVGTVSVTIDGVDTGHAGRVLSDEYDIMVRPGLHCAPEAHRAIGTFPDGTVRLSLSWMTKPAEIAETVEALGKIISEFR